MSLTERDDVIRSRIVTALDRLPVPAGPGRLRPRPRATGRPQPLLVFAALLLILAATLAAPPVRDAVAEAAKWLERMLTTPAWVGYYLDLSDRDAAGLRTQRVMFLAAGVPGMPVAMEASRQTDRGPWSADGQRIFLLSGAKVYVADAVGAVRQVIDLGDLGVRRASWIGAEAQEIVVDAATRGCSTPTLTEPCDVIARIDLRTGVVSRTAVRTPFEGSKPIYSRFSPDGRWQGVLISSGGCLELNGLYEVATGRLLELVDGRARPLSAIGWLRDGRLVSGICDWDAGTLELFIAPPDQAPAAPIITLPLSPRGPFFSRGFSWNPVIVDASGERILALTGQTDRTVFVIGLDGTATRLVQLPTLTTDAEQGVVLHSLSRDGKYLSFTVRGLRAGGPEVHETSRTGLIDVRTGQVTWACEVPAAALSPAGSVTGCFGLMLR